MAGALYIWILAAFFLIAAAIFLFLVGGMWLGHWINRRETGAQHGFLELPEELRPKPTPSSPPDPSKPA